MPPHEGKSAYDHPWPERLEPEPPLPPPPPPPVVVRFFGLERTHDFIAPAWPWRLAMVHHVLALWEYYRGNPVGERYLFDWLFEIFYYLY